ncbi:MAG TPA: hypothetical protein VGQ93_07525 [Lysobacter sp.]|jgi:hypothetical protein|nr:hypothetical protein [Lysobacter sp.]
MKVRLVFVVALMAVAVPAWAGDDPIGELSNQTGVSERHVRMILGNRTPYAEYPYTYHRELKRFKAGIGEANYQRLMSGQPILLRTGKEVQVRVASN